MHDSILSVLGSGIGKALSLVAGVFVARYLGKEIYGEFGMIKTTLLNISILSTFGLGYTATKHVADYRISAPEKQSAIIHHSQNITFIFSFIIALTFFVFSNDISVHLLNNNRLSTPLKSLSILIILNALVTVQTGVIAGLGLFKELAYINALIGIASFLFTVPLTYLYGFEGALISIILSQIVNYFLNRYLIKKFRCQNIHEDKTSVNYIKLVSFSAPIALQELTYAITSWAAIIILVKMADYGELGLYVAAIHWNALVLFIPGVIRNVILSHFSSSISDKQKLGTLLNQTLLVNFLSTLVPCIIIFIMSSMISKFYGDNYAGLDVLISLAVLSTLFLSANNVYSQLFISLGKNWVLFVLKFTRGLFSLLLFAYILYRYSVQGAMTLIIINLLFDFLFLLITMGVYNVRKLNWHKSYQARGLESSKVD